MVPPQIPSFRWRGRHVPRGPVKANSYCLKQMTVSVALLSVLACWTKVCAETLVVIDDFETNAGAWSNSRLVDQPAHEGGFALRWDVSDRPILDCWRFLADWREFDEIRFWAFLAEPVDFKIPLVIVSDGGYYIVDWKLDWEGGWKEHRIKLADCKPSGKPAGWHRIKSLGFRAQGYGQGSVPAGLRLVFDDFSLHCPKQLPYARIEDHAALMHRERLKELKARGNPYFASALDSLKDVKAEPNLPDGFDSCWTFSGLAGHALTAAWAAGSDDSPRKGDKTLVRRACAFTEFCLAKQSDGSWFYSRQWKSGDPNCDRFTLGPIMDAIWWLRRLPDMEENWRCWEAPLRKVVDFQYVHWGCYEERGFTNNVAWGGAAYRYPNQDVFHLFEMELAYRWWKDKKYRVSALKTLDGLEAQLLPDGGIRYIGPETECPVYHNLNLVWLARYLQLTDDERARNLIMDTVDYYPLTFSNEGYPESYSDCWWKHHWNDSSPAGPEIVAGLTGDENNKWLANRLLERVGPGDNYQTIYAGMCYRNDVSEEPLPDRWLKLDRNIGGPRGRFGDWYFAGVPGGGARDTFVGAMISQPERCRPLNGALMAVNVEVGLGGEGRREHRHFYLSGPDDITDSTIVGNAAVLGARYWLRKPYINSKSDPDVPPTSWPATQIWLLTGDALVGLVELDVDERQTVPYVSGELRFGPKLPLTRDDDGVFRCGAMAMRVLEHNFDRIDHGQARPGYAEIVKLGHAVTLRTAGDTYTAEPGQPLRFAAVAAPHNAQQVSQFKRISQSGAVGFSVHIADRTLAVALNPIDKAVSMSIPGFKQTTIPPRRTVLVIQRDKNHFP